MRTTYFIRIRSTGLLLTYLLTCTYTYAAMNQVFERIIVMQIYIFTPTGFSCELSYNATGSSPIHYYTILVHSRICILHWHRLRSCTRVMTWKKKNAYFISRYSHSLQVPSRGQRHEQKSKAAKTLHSPLIYVAHQAPLRPDSRWDN